MRSIVAKTVLVVLAVSFFCGPSVYAECMVPSVFTENVNSIPNLCQTDPNAGFPYGGVHFCGPTAISNSIMWLARNGFERLASDQSGRANTQPEVACTLSSGKYMNTTLEDGTSPSSVLKGVSKYILDRGYHYESLKYQGWRDHPRQFDMGVKVPDLDWIKSGMIGDSAVWLNVGWYEYKPDKDRYRRVGGHWVTLVGFGVDQYGNQDPNVLLIHDPAPSDGLTFANHYMKVQRLGSGIIKPAPDETIRAAGFYLLSRSTSPKGKIRCGILDGAVVLKMKSSETQTAGPDKKNAVRTGNG